MKNAWFFGCSFTSGFGYNFDEYSDPESDSYKENFDLDSDELWESAPYLNWCKDWKTTHQYEIWPHLVSDYFGLNCINKGEAGASNQRILHKLIRNLANFKQGDLVFIGFTHPTRILIPTNLEYPKISTLLLEGNERGKIPDDKGNTRLFGNHNNLTDDQQHTLVDYLYDIVHEYWEDIEEYDYKTFTKLVEYLKTVEIQPFLWDYSYWSYYQNIYVYTKGKVYDGHWSINGHKDFSETVINAINEDRYILTPKEVRNDHFKLKKSVI